MSMRPLRAPVPIERIPRQDDTPGRHGRWLTTARAGWVVVALVIMGLNILAVPHAFALSQSICAPDSQCLGGQLTQQDLRTLHQLGLTPGFLAAYSIAWDLGTVLIYSVLAALLVWRRSTDRMALFCAYMLVLLGGATYTQLLDVGLRAVAPVWFWLVGGLELVAQVSVPTFFLLFPGGRFAPRWTRWCVLAFVLYEVWYVFFTDQFSGLVALVFAGLLLGLVGLQVYRFRHVSTFQERQQTKWVIFGLASALGGLALLLILVNLAIAPVLLNSLIAGLLAETITDALLLLIPISIAIAILRSRLFDIDVIIRRTLVYGSLSAILGVVYFGSVVGMQRLASALAGPQASQNPLIIVLSTLLIAALFMSLRRQLQAIIDRRFYRAKYDTARTLESFAATLRSETDLAQLGDHLIGVVEATMRPAHVSLWLREIGQSGRSGRSQGSEA